MATIFEKYAAKGNEFLSLLKDDLKMPEDKALRILKSVLHTIRDHISWQQSLQVMSSLPMMIKAVYVDQWNYSEQVKSIHHLNDFFEEIRAHDNQQAEYDFVDKDDTRNAAKAVIRTLNYYLSDGEMNDMIAVMPAEIKRFIIDTVGTGRMAM